MSSILGDMGSSALLPRDQAALSLLGLKPLPRDIEDFTYHRKSMVLRSHLNERAFLYKNPF